MAHCFAVCVIRVCPSPHHTEGSFGVVVAFTLCLCEVVGILAGPVPAVETVDVGAQLMLTFSENTLNGALVLPTVDLTLYGP